MRAAFADIHTSAAPAALPHANENLKALSGASAPSPFAQAADQLVAGGYSAITILPRDKAPGEWQGSLQNGRWVLQPGWNAYGRRPPEPAQIERWKSWPDANVGVVLGTIVGGYQLIAIDFDTDDDELDQLRSQIPPSRMAKRGARGFTAFYRASSDVRTKRYMVGEKPNMRCVLEILTGNAPRQTVMPPSMHPTGQAYQWLTGEGIVPIHLLPVLKEEHFEALEDTLEHMGWKGTIAAPARDRATTPSDNDDPNIWRSTNVAALARFDSWVGELGLPKLKRHGNGRWEGVAHWRASGTGQPMHLRKPNLSFHPSGIKDLGTEQGYSALDVVQAAFGWDFDTCFGWLRGRIGLSTDDTEFTAPEKPVVTVERSDGAIEHLATGNLVGVITNDNNSQHDVGDFPEALTHVPGLLGEAVDWITATARNPSRVLALGAALTVLGTLAGRRDAGPTKAGTALFVLMLAKSGLGKQHGLNQIFRMMEVAGAKEHIGSGEFGSVQALNNILKKKPLCVCAQDEFGSFFGRINARNAGGHEKAIAKVFRTIWGVNFGVTQTTDFAGTPGQTIHAPALSIYGVSTPGEFYKSLGGSDIENGTLNRFLLLSASATGEEVEPELDDAIVPEHLAHGLSDLYLARDRRPPLFDDNQGASPVAPHIVRWHDHAAEAVFRGFKADVAAMRLADEESAPFLARTVEIGLRLATIRAVGRVLDDPMVDADDMAWARDVALWSARKMAVDVGDFVSSNATGELWGKIKNKLRKAGGAFRYNEVARAFTLDKKAMDSAVTGMVEAELIWIENRLPSGPGKPTRWLHLSADRSSSR